MPSKEAASTAGDPAQDSSKTQYRAYGTSYAGFPNVLAMLIRSRMTDQRGNPQLSIHANPL